MSVNSENPDRLSSSVSMLFNEANEQNVHDESNAKILDAAMLLTKIATNITNNPSIEKYRQIRLSNALFMNKLLPITGAVECLFEMGFEEDGDHLTFPKSTSLKQLDLIVSQINKSVSYLKENKSQDTARKEPNAPKLPEERRNTLASQNQLLNLLKRNSAHVKMYESANLQEKARSILPSDCLKYADGKSHDSKDSDCDKVLLKLLSWFKNKFFTWTDRPKCHVCGAVTQAVGPGHPNQEDVKWMASVIELYRCTKCSAVTRFPRYNHPEKLLQTRTGRCGEYANCFTLMCRASGFEARYIYDYTDHVWTEIFSDKQQRWLHCDPCEDKCDSPLMYEQGWKKSLSYIFAFSATDVMDVTWRYTKDHQQVLSRRNLCDETWLVRTMWNMKKQLQSNLSKEMEQILQLRLVKEIVEYMTPVNSSSGEYGGRTSGSLSWRISRGETEQSKRIQNNYKFKLTDKEVAHRKFHLQYCCGSDEYIRISNANEKIPDFGSCVMWQKAVHRKVEHDWKMAYLAREPSTSQAILCWSFDFSGSNLTIDKMSLKVPGTTFENGVINVKLQVESNTIPVDYGKENIVKEELKNKSMFMLVAELSGGRGDNAWQHSQLFRQSMDSLDHTLEIEIDFVDQVTTS